MSWNHTNLSDVIGADLRRLPVTKVWEFQLGMLLVEYLLLPIVIAGTVGNGLSLAVLLRRRMRTNSVNLYLACLAVADTLVLYLSGLKTWLRVVTSVELLHASAASCKVLTFLFMTALHVSAWLIVLVTTDRFIVVWFPFRATVLCTKRRGLTTIAIMVLLVLVYNTHLFWTIDLLIVSPSNMLQCAGSKGNTFMNGPYELMKLVSYAVVPFTLVLLMNIGIIIKICRHSPSHLETEAPLRRQSLRSDKRLVQSRQQLTVMLLVVSFTWLTLSTPFPLIAIFPARDATTRERAAQFLAKTVCFLLMYLNHSINFFLYCVAGRKFRHELIAVLKELFAYCWKMDRQNSISTGSSKLKSKQKMQSKRTPPTREDVEVYNVNNG